MRSVTFLVAVLSVAPLGNLAAQQPIPIEPGGRVRITARDLFGINKYTGVLGAVDRDTLAVGTLRIAVGSVTRLEVSRGRKRHTGKGVWYGLVLGLVAGGFVGALTYEPPPPSPCVWFCDNLGVLTALDWVPRMFSGAGIGAGIGAVAGALVGSAIKTEQWEEVPLNQLRVSFAPQRDGRFALGLSVGF